MFTPHLLANHIMSAATAGACASISAEIAYAPGLETSHIEVSVEDGTICLRGAAPNGLAIDRAVAIASEIVGYRVRNRIALRR
jgi:osmotically-inducible protein OsmY